MSSSLSVFNYSNISFKDVDVSHRYVRMSASYIILYLSHLAGFQVYALWPKTVRPSDSRTIGNVYLHYFCIPI